MDESTPRAWLGRPDDGSAAGTAPGSPASDASRSALVLYAALLDAETLRLGAHRLAAALALDGGFDRVSIGLHEAGRTRLIGSSHLDLAQLPADLEAALIGAMDEALDQGIPLTCPAAAGHGAAAVTVEQRILWQRVGGAVATVPLGAAGQRFAAVCVERRNTPAAPGAVLAGVLPFDAVELQRLEQMLMLAAPALRWLQLAAEPWWRRAGREGVRRWAVLRRPERVGARRWLVGAALAAAGVGLVPLQDSVAGRARIEGAEQRVLAAPTDGFIKTAHVRPGDRVHAGSPLVDLLDADLRLEHDRWTSQIAQHENAYAAAMGRSDRVVAATSVARINEAQAQLALVAEQLLRSRLVAPFDGQIIQGDLAQSIGAPVRQGDTLLTIATTGRYRVIVEIDEVDILRVVPGQRGELALSSLPWDGDEIVVERVAPTARATEGRNVFEVEARLVAPRDDLRPGLLGRATLASGHAPLLWSWSRHALLRLRVALWTWLD